VEGLVLFGGINIKVKKLRQNQIKDFADQLKSLLGLS